ncbi:hypothetical protein RUND412_000952 [Rhizina undulata]
MSRVELMTNLNTLPAVTPPERRYTIFVAITILASPQTNLIDPQSRMSKSAANAKLRIALLPTVGYIAAFTDAAGECLVDRFGASKIKEDLNNETGLSIASKSVGPATCFLNCSRCYFSDYGSDSAPPSSSLSPLPPLFLSSTLTMVRLNIAVDGLLVGVEKNVVEENASLYATEKRR